MHFDVQLKMEQYVWFCSLQELAKRINCWCLSALKIIFLNHLIIQKMMSPVWKEQALFNYEDVQSVDDDVIENREDVECNELNYEQQQELEAALYSQIHYEPTSGEAPSHLDGVDFLVEDLIANISDADQLTVPVCKNDSVHQKKRPTCQLDNEPEADQAKSESGEQWISTLMGLTSGSADEKSPRLDQHEKKSDISSSTSLQDFLMKNTLVRKKKKSDVCSISISSEDESSASEMSTITEASSDSFDSDSDFVLDLDEEKVDDTIVFNKGKIVANDISLCNIIKFIINRLSNNHDNQ